MTAANKVDNPYRELLSDEFYAAIPKAVLAAILVSGLMKEGWYGGEFERAIHNEWSVLHDSGIVPQPPNRHGRSS